MEEINDEEYENPALAIQINRIIEELFTEEVKTMENNNCKVARNIQDSRIVYLSEGIGHPEFFLKEFNRIFNICRERGDEPQKAESKALYLSLCKYKEEKSN